MRSETSVTLRSRDRPDSIWRLLALVLHKHHMVHFQARHQRTGKHLFISFFFCPHNFLLPQLPPSHHLPLLPPQVWSADSPLCWTQQLPGQSLQQLLRPQQSDSFIKKIKAEKNKSSQSHLALVRLFSHQFRGIEMCCAGSVFFPFLLMQKRQILAFNYCLFGHESIMDRYRKFYLCKLSSIIAAQAFVRTTWTCCGM